MKVSLIDYTVAPDIDVKALKEAVAKASIVKLTMDTRRWAICTEDDVMTSFEVIQ